VQNVHQLTYPQRSVHLKSAHLLSPAHHAPITLFSLAPAAITNNRKRTRTPTPSIPSTMAPIRRANTNANRRSRRHDPLRADAAFADAFDEAHQDHLGHESDVNVEDELPLSDNEFASYVCSTSSYRRKAS
jgi:hypothetical protein